MCNKASILVIYQKGSTKNKTGVATSVQEPQICNGKNIKKQIPVITVNPDGDSTPTPKKTINVAIFDENKKLKNPVKLEYAWSTDKNVVPTSSWKALDIDTDKKKGNKNIVAKGLIGVNYLWIRSKEPIDSYNNEIMAFPSGPFNFLAIMQLSYDDGGNNCSTKKKEVVNSYLYGQDIDKNEAKLCVPSREGYDFKGWTLEGSEVKDTTEVTKTADHTIIANWDAITVTINLNKNSATNTPTDKLTIKYGTSALNPSTITVPERVYTVSLNANSTGATISSLNQITSRYNFDGWNTTASGGTKVINNATSPALVSGVTDYTNGRGEWERLSNTTLYAKWSSDAVTLPTITKTGYTCGWATSSTGNIAYNSGASFTPTTNITLYAKCSPAIYNISYSNCYTQASSGMPDQYTYGVGTTINGTPTRTGYTFMGYTYGSNNSFSHTVSSTTSGNQSLSCNWCQNCASVANGSCRLSVVAGGTCTYTTSCNTGYTISGNGTRNPTCTINQYRLSYNKNDSSATGTMSDTICNYNQYCTIANNLFNRSGYRFTGWRTAGGTYYSPGGSIKITSNTTLYAQWERTNYRVTYNSRYVVLSNDTNTQVVTYYGDSTNVKEGRIEIPTNSCNTFDGWYTDKSLRTPFVLENHINENIEVYAKYTGNEFCFPYTGGKSQFIAYTNSNYKLEVWGASGAGSYRGYGGYSVGTASLNNVRLYIYPGGEGKENNNLVGGAGGYNGGGAGGKAVDCDVCGVGGRGGGGATHIATASGLLKDLSSNQGSVLIVAGGGGGAVHDQTARGSGHGGGTNAGAGNYDENGSSSGGTQNSGYAFGQGMNGRDGTTREYTNSRQGNGGSGGGWYGGITTTVSKPYKYTNSSGGGGSGYLKSTLSNSQMYCYSGCGGANTININQVGSHVANKANDGNGYAKITVN